MSCCLGLGPGSAAGPLWAPVPLSKALQDGRSKGAALKQTQGRVGAGPGIGDRDGDVAKGLRPGWGSRDWLS